MISYRLDGDLLHRMFDLDERLVDRYLTSLRDQGVAEPPHVLGPRLLEHLTESLAPAEAE